VFTVYDVENTEEGQREVCKALAAHYESSFWCLSTFTANGEPTESAKHYWKEYDAIPRKIAYENGKPVAFCSDSEGHVPPAIKGTLNGAEFIRIAADLAYAWDQDSMSAEEIDELINEGLAYKTSNILWLTEKGISQADFGPNDPFDNLNDSKRELWWDTTDTSPQRSLDDSIVSEYKTPEQRAQIIEEARNQALQEQFEEYLRAGFPEPVNPDQEEVSDLPFFITPQGEIYGFITPEGDIYLDETVISPEHPIHEFTHMWDAVVSKKNPKLWNRGVELMKDPSLKLPGHDKSIWQEIEESPNYGQKWKKSKHIDGKTLEFLIASEVHSRLVGTKGEKLLNKLSKEKGSSNIINKLRDWILEFWNALKQTFSNFSENELRDLSIKEFNAMTIRDFANINNIKEIINYYNHERALESAKKQYTRPSAQYTEINAADNLMSQQDQINELNDIFKKIASGYGISVYESPDDKITIQTKDSNMKKLKSDWKERLKEFGYYFAGKPIYVSGKARVKVYKKITLPKVPNTVKPKDVQSVDQTHEKDIDYYKDYHLMEQEQQYDADVDSEEFKQRYVSPNASVGELQTDRDLMESNPQSTSSSTNNSRAYTTPNTNLSSITVRVYREMEEIDRDRNEYI